jgi:glutamyl-tRNA synthetase
MVRVRFAPSPTGYLHIGGARTALFNWLFAKRNNGKFILRIEDTDKKRSKKKYLDEILYSLKWLGLDYDEIYFQSKRLKIYREFAERLLKNNYAYKQKKAIIFRVPPQKIKVDDLIHGIMEFDTSLIKDQVLIKSDGTPTYNFACVVDDALLEISHVIRGDDHISNTPKQILLYEAFRFKIPKFCHIPLILSKEGGRLSKRKAAVSISDYRKKGYLPEAIRNYLLLLGWSPGQNREIVSLDEAISNFSLEKVNRTAATFDLDKLNWINREYIKRTDDEKLADLLIPLLLKRYKNLFWSYGQGDRERLISVVKLFKQRISTLNDFVLWSDYFFKKRIEISPEAKEKYLSQDLSYEFKRLIERFEGLSSFDAKSLEMTFRELVSELGISTSQLIHPVRVALTGKTVGPGLFEIISVLGKERVRERLERFIK